MMPPSGLRYPRKKLKRSQERLAEQWVDLWSHRRPVLASGITILAVTLAAAGSVVIEVWTENHEWVRLLISIVSAVLLVILLLTQARVTKERGTLYYVRLIGGWMPDLYADMESEFGNTYGDEKVVAEHIIAQPRQGVWDLSDQVASVTHKLQLLMAQDDTRTSFTIAPNMLYAVALAVGYRMHAPKDTRLIEFGGDGEQAITWRMAKGGGEELPDTKVVSIGPQLPADGDPDVRSVLLSVYLTPNSHSFAPRGLKTDRCHVVGILDEDGRPVSVTLHQPGAPATGAKTAPDFESATRAVIAAITQTLTSYPRATVYLAARLPKTVAIAVGHGLGGPGRANGTPIIPPAARRPWSRLVPLLLNQESSNDPAEPSFLVARVDPAQPEVAELSALAIRDGLLIHPPDGEHTHAAT